MLGIVRAFLAFFTRSQRLRETTVICGQNVAISRDLNSGFLCIGRSLSRA